MVFQELAPSQSHKIKNRNDLESELFGSYDGAEGALPNIRDNEGEAAEHGIFFDDTEYDYMQHVRDLDTGSGNGEIVFVEAPTKKREGKGKGRMNLEDALRESSLQDEWNSNEANQQSKSQLLDSESSLSKGSLRDRYQSQQDVPDTLAGFQPDMDPRLREVLEALDDDAYVDDEEETFGELAKQPQEVSLNEFEETRFGVGDEEDLGWETDETEKPEKGSDTRPTLSLSDQTSTDAETADTFDHGDGDWLKAFSKFKHAERTKTPKAQPSDMQSSILTGTSMTGGRRKKRKGAMTSSTGYSMTSSSLFRTEGQSVLDARFDKVEEEYAEDEMDLDDGTASMMTGSSLASSQAPSLSARSDFDSIMDDFLGGYSMSGKKRVKKGGHQSGMEQLDEVRKGLGPARIKAQKA